MTDVKEKLKTPAKDDLIKHDERKTNEDKVITRVTYRDLDMIEGIVIVRIIPMNNEAPPKKIKSKYTSS
jgi:hypothetical protein